MGRAVYLTVVVVLIALALEARVDAYLDPGAGSMLLQVLLGGFAAAGVVLKLFWHNLAKPFRKLDARDGNEQ